jgi:hypothetical protein
LHQQELHAQLEKAQHALQNLQGQLQLKHSEAKQARHELSTARTAAQVAEGKGHQAILEGQRLVDEMHQLQQKLAQSGLTRQQTDETRCQEVANWKRQQTVARQRQDAEIEEIEALLQVEKGKRVVAEREGAEVRARTALRVAQAGQGKVQLEAEVKVSKQQQQLGREHEARHLAELENMQVSNAAAGMRTGNLGALHAKNWESGDAPLVSLGRNSKYSLGAPRAMPPTPRAAPSSPHTYNHLGPEFTRGPVSTLPISPPQPRP